MSSLGSLFSSNQSPDSTDTLKYNAPKEPKLNKQSSSSTTTTSKVANSTQPLSSSASSSTKAQQAVVTSKIMVSAAVRLFKFNTVSNIYDSIENSSVLGCVLMGSGLSFQILVYNAQKVPQAVVPITTTFDYTLRDLYMSFSDSSGNQWSLLFDTIDVMISFIRHVVMTILHLLTHHLSNTISSSEVSIKRSLPSRAATLTSASQIADEGEDTKLSVGMTAGIQLCAFEVGGDVNSFPGDILTASPYFTSGELIKYKLSNTGELIGGLTSVLVGSRRGECCLVGVSPKLFYESSSKDGPLDLASRKYPGSWMLFEVEVCKIKSSEKKKEKVIHNMPTPVEAVSPITSISNPSTNITERMAYLATSQSHFGSRQSHQQQKLAEVMNESNTHNSSNSSNYSNNRKDLRRDEKDNESFGNKVIHENTNNYKINYEKNSSNNKESYSDYNENNNSSRYENRLTVIDGQESRSYYTSEPDGGSGSDYYYRDNQRPYKQHTQSTSAMNQTFPQNMSNSNYNDYNLNNNTTTITTNNNTINNSLQLLQQSMVQLHSKVDQVGAQVANSYAFQQQQALTLHSTSANLPYNNFNLLQQQQQQQQQLLLQHMNGILPNPLHTNHNLYNNSTALNTNSQYMLAVTTQQQQNNNSNNYNSNNNNINSNNINTNNNTSSTMRLKTEDVISTLHFILQEYEAGKVEVAKYNSSLNNIQNHNNPSQEQQQQQNDSLINTLKSNLEKFEEKNQLLQTKNEKLMSEKSDLLEKHADLIQASSTSSSKFYQLQMEFDNLKREKSDLILQFNNKNEDSKKILSIRDEEIKVLKEIQQPKHLLDSSILSHHDSLEVENRLLNSEIETNKQYIIQLEATLNKYQSSTIKHEEDIQLLECKINENYIHIEQQDQLIIKLKNELNSMTNNEDDKDIHISSKVIVKAIMQDVYDKACEYFNDDDNDDDNQRNNNETQYTTSEILKRLRLVLKFVSNKNTMQEGNNI